MGSSHACCIRYSASCLDGVVSVKGKQDNPEETPGYGEHFTTFCIKYCPCGYNCKDVIGEDGKWRRTTNAHSCDMKLREGVTKHFLLI